MRIRSLLIILMIALIITACGQQTNGSATGSDSPAGSPAAAGSPATTESPAAAGSPAPATGEQVTITYGMWAEAQRPVMEQTIEEFQKQHPNIKVDLQVTPWNNYWDKLRTAAAGGAVNDVLWMNGPNFPFYASRGQLLDLQPYMDRDQFQADKYPENILNLYTYNDHHYAGPRDFDTIALFYNKDMFDEAGIPYPDDSWDWNTMLDAAQKLTKAPDQWGMVVWPNLQEQYLNFLYSNGGSVLSEDKTTCALDRPEAVQAFQFLVDMIYEHKVSQLPQAMGDDPLIFFKQGKAAMITTGSWRVGQFSDEIQDFEWGIAPLPKSPNTDERVSVIHGIGNVVSANTEHPDEAWEFVKFMATQPGQELLASTGSQIPTLEGLAQEWQAAHPDYNTQVFLDAIDNSKELESTVSFGEWSAVMGDGLTQIYNNQVPVEQGLQNICTQMNQILANEQ
jgi:multiple sugar transport system substrate-binding protein